MDAGKEWNSSICVCSASHQQPRQSLSSTVKAAWCSSRPRWVLFCKPHRAPDRAAPSPRQRLESSLVLESPGLCWRSADGRGPRIPWASLCKELHRCVDLGNFRRKRGWSIAAPGTQLEHRRGDTQDAAMPSVLPLSARFSQESSVPAASPVLLFSKSESYVHVWRL